MKGTVKAIIAGVVIMVIGAGILIGALAVNGWSFRTPKFEMQTYTSSADLTKLDIKIDAGSVKTEFYDGEEIIIEYPSSSIYKTTVTEKEGSLVYTAKIRGLVRLAWNIPDTVIKLPEKVYDCKFDMNAGSVILADGRYGLISLDIDAGSFKAGAVTCGNVNIDMSAGSFKADSLDCTGFVLDMSAGYASAAKMTCPEINIDLSAGSAVIGLTNAKSEYTISTDVSAGKCNVSPQTATTGKTIKVDISAGNVEFSFGV